MRLVIFVTLQIVNDKTVEPEGGKGEATSPKEMLSTTTKWLEHTLLQEDMESWIYVNSADSKDKASALCCRLS